jgi:hypothetical protein
MEKRHYITSPTEDRSEGELKTEVVEKETACDEDVVKDDEHLEIKDLKDLKVEEDDEDELSFPKFPMVKDGLDMRNEELDIRDRLAFLIYTFAGNVSNHKMVAVHHIIEVLYETEHALFELYRSKKSVFDPEVIRLMSNRKVCILELMNAFGVRKKKSETKR